MPGYRYWSDKELIDQIAHLKEKLKSARRVYDEDPRAFRLAEITFFEGDLKAAARELARRKR